jgi:YVTN family beta-propeller protein
MYAYVPDLYGDTLTVLDVEAFEIIEQVDVPPVVGSAGAPWMGTAAPDGETLLVEHNEGSAGTESVWDTSDPAAPEERVRLTSDDGLGERPLTSEIGPDSATGYVFTPGTNDVSVVDLDAGTVTDRIDVGGSAFVGTWGPNHEKLYVPVQSSDEVKVVDHATRSVTATIPVGARPYGATAGTVRPGERVLESGPSSRESLQRRLSDEGTTYCIGNCACGHQL